MTTLFDYNYKINHIIKVKKKFWKYFSLGEQREWQTYCHIFCMNSWKDPCRSNIPSFHGIWLDSFKWLSSLADQHHGMYWVPDSSEGISSGICTFFPSFLLKLDSLGEAHMKGALHEWLRSCTSFDKRFQHTHFMSIPDMWFPKFIHWIDLTILFNKNLGWCILQHPCK